MIEEPVGGHDAASVERLGLYLLGSLAPLRDAAVVHVTAVHPCGDTLTTMRIGPSTPKSPHDFFLLSFVRAHADAIVSTLKNLRDEPRLRFELLGAGTIGRGLAGYREQTLGKRARPRLLLLSRDGEVDLQHPALHGWPRPALVMPQAAAEHTRRRIERAAMADAIEVWPMADSSLRAVVQHARTFDDVHTVSIEAGPSTTGALYRPPSMVDALVLARFEGPAIPEEVVGGTIPGEAQLHALLPHSEGRRRVEEDSGPWSFELLHRGRALSRPR